MARICIDTTTNKITVDPPAGEGRRESTRPSAKTSGTSAKRAETPAAKKTAAKQKASKKAPPPKASAAKKAAKKAPKKATKKAAKKATKKVAEKVAKKAAKKPPKKAASKKASKKPAKNAKGSPKAAPAAGAVAEVPPSTAAAQRGRKKGRKKSGTSKKGGKAERAVAPSAPALPPKKWDVDVVAAHAVDRLRDRPRTAPELANAIGGPPHELGSVPPKVMKRAIKKGLAEGTIVPLGWQNGESVYAVAGDDLVDEADVELGAAIEAEEHPRERSTAAEIARDHLKDDPHYYDREAKRVLPASKGWTAAQRKIGEELRDHLAEGLTPDNVRRLKRLGLHRKGIEKTSPDDRRRYVDDMRRLIEAEVGVPPSRLRTVPHTPPRAAPGVERLTPDIVLVGAVAADRAPQYMVWQRTDSGCLSTAASRLVVQGRETVDPSTGQRVTHDTEEAALMAATRELAPSSCQRVDPVWLSAVELRERALAGKAPAAADEALDVVGAVPVPVLDALLLRYIEPDPSPAQRTATRAHLLMEARAGALTGGLPVWRTDLLRELAANRRSEYETLFRSWIERHYKEMAAAEDNFAWVVRDERPVLARALAGELALPDGHEAYFLARWSRPRLVASDLAAVSLQTFRALADKGCASPERWARAMVQWDELAAILTALLKMKTPTGAFFDRVLEALDRLDEMVDIRNGCDRAVVDHSQLAKATETAERIETLLDAAIDAEGDETPWPWPAMAPAVVGMAAAEAMVPTADAPTLERIAEAAELPPARREDLAVALKSSDLTIARHMVAEDVARLLEGEIGVEHRLDLPGLWLTSLARFAFVGGSEVDQAFLSDEIWADAMADVQREITVNGRSAVVRWKWAGELPINGHQDEPLRGATVDVFVDGRYWLEIEDDVAPDGDVGPPLVSIQRDMPDLDVDQAVAAAYVAVRDFVPTAAEEKRLQDGLLFGNKDLIERLTTIWHSKLAKAFHTADAVVDAQGNVRRKNNEPVIGEGQWVFVAPRVEWEQALVGAHRLLWTVRRQPGRGPVFTGTPDLFGWTALEPGDERIDELRGLLLWLPILRDWRVGAWHDVLQGLRQAQVDAAHCQGERREQLLEATRVGGAALLRATELAGTVGEMVALVTALRALTRALVVSGQACTAGQMSLLPVGQEVGDVLAEVDVQLRTLTDKQLDIVAVTTPTGTIEFRFTAPSAVRLVNQLASIEAANKLLPSFLRVALAQKRPFGGNSAFDERTAVEVTREGGGRIGIANAASLERLLKAALTPAEFKAVAQALGNDLDLHQEGPTVPGRPGAEAWETTLAPSATPPTAKQWRSRVMGALRSFQGRHPFSPPEAEMFGWIQQRAEQVALGDADIKAGLAKSYVEYMAPDSEEVEEEQYEAAVRDGSQFGYLGLLAVREYGRIAKAAAAPLPRDDLRQRHPEGPAAAKEKPAKEKPAKEKPAKEKKPKEKPAKEKKESETVDDRILAAFSGGDELTIGAVARRAGVDAKLADTRLTALERANLLSSTGKGKARKFRRLVAGGGPPPPSESAPPPPPPEARKVTDTSTAALDQAAAEAMRGMAGMMAEAF